MRKSKIKIAVISILLVLSMVLSVSARQSAYFSSYSIYMIANSGGKIAVSGDITAVGNADKLGILILNIIDYDTGEVIKTVEQNYKNNDSSYDYSYYGQGIVGHRYYVEVTYDVHKGNGSETKYMTAGPATAKK